MISQVWYILCYEIRSRDPRASLLAFPITDPVTLGKSASTNGPYLGLNTPPCLFCSKTLCLYEYCHFQRIPVNSVDLFRSEGWIVAPSTQTTSRRSPVRNALHSRRPVSTPLPALPSEWPPMERQLADPPSGALSTPPSSCAADLQRVSSFSLFGFLPQNKNCTEGFVSNCETSLNAGSSCAFAAGSLAPGSKFLWSPPRLFPLAAETPRPLRTMAAVEVL